MSVFSVPRLRANAREWRESVLFLLLVGPNLLLLAAFTFWPMIYNAYLSTISWNFLSPIRRFVGLRNYETVLSSEIFRVVLINTAVFTVVSVAATMALGLGLALLLNQPLRWREGARAVLFTPTVLSGAAIAIVWIYIFDPRFGLLAQILGWFGILSPNWLADPNWAMTALLIVYIWKNTGYAVVIYLAGLQTIDRTLYEAARIDGAGPWGQFWHVTLPGLSPIIFFLLVTSILACFQAFDIIRVMTDGGPVNATNMLVYHLYERGFIQSQAGPAGVVAMVMFVLMLILTLLQLRFLGRRVHYS
ncbi:carbohydrate ABC transporter permease [Roseiflexus sp.]|uniref:carbohydrate ABC transporter permease n=1 Tax=Roseiflexus sp. TaxID=2562120 RepID=UPI0021DD7D7E|nr:sugar ABC transporter permease [Roseiflexus sp.]GIV99011.1 MAG: glycerol-3-phosphate ABC transporter permease [Roseiflexus sp.]